MRICERIAQGTPLTVICADEGMPALGTVYRWIESDETFRDRYTRAREDQAETLADQIQRLADAVDHSDRGAVDKARLQIDARKWVAAKLKPKVYGDRISQDVTIAGMSDVLREASAMLEQAKGKR
jgi:hypothetical protein